MRAYIAWIVSIFVAVNVAADVWSRSFKVEPPGYTTDIVQAPDGSILVTRAGLGGPCVTRFVRDTVETNCYGHVDENS